MPTVYALAAERIAQPADLVRRLASAFDERQQTRQRSPVAAAGGLDQRVRAP